MAETRPDTQQEGETGDREVTVKNQIYAKLVEAPKSTGFWIFIVFLILTLFGLWYLGWLSWLKIPFFWIIGIGYVVFLLWSLISGIQETDKEKGVTKRLTFT